MADEGNPFVGLIIVVILAAVVLAVVYIFLIRHRVGRYMRHRVRPQSGTMPVVEPAVERHGGAPLQLANEVAPHTPLSDAGRALFDRMGNARRSAAAVYLLAGLAAASVLAAGEYTAAGKWNLLMVVYIWPAILTVSTIAVPSLRKRALVLAASPV
jgi:hypothetical protein